MKKVFFASLLIFAAIAFASCSSSDDTNTDPNGGNTTVTPEIVAAFNTLYPDANNVNWTKNGQYFVAGFTRSTLNVGAEAWFETAANWQLTVTDIQYTALPQAVRTTFESGIYADWRVDDVDMVERVGFETIYVLEVENGNLEYDLYFSAEGIMIKAVADSSNNNDSSGYIPQPITTTMEQYIATNYPNARIVEIDRESNRVEVDIIDGTTHRELTFTPEGQWQMTVSGLRFTSLPQTVQTAFNASEYRTWRVEDVDMVERPAMDNVYVIEIESGNQEAELYYAEDGTLVKTILDNDDDDEWDDGEHNYQPGQVPDAMQDYIDANYPGARVVDIERENNRVEIDIIDGTTPRELAFTTAGEWIYTQTEMRRSQLPQTILNAFNSSAYARYSIDDIDFYQTATQGEFYLLELEAEPNDINLKITTAGVVEVVGQNYI